MHHTNLKKQQEQQILSGINSFDTKEEVFWTLPLMLCLRYTDAEMKWHFVACRI